METVARWVEDEYQSKKGQQVSVVGAWEVIYPKNIPIQYNKVDCGVFVLKYIEYLSQDKPFDFDNTHMAEYRKDLLVKIVTSS